MYVYVYIHLYIYIHMYIHVYIHNTHVIISLQVRDRACTPPGRLKFNRVQHACLHSTPYNVHDHA